MKDAFNCNTAEWKASENDFLCPKNNECAERDNELGPRPLVDAIWTTGPDNKYVIQIWQKFK